MTAYCCYNNIKPLNLFLIYRLELRVQLMHFVSAALVFNVSEVPQVNVLKLLLTYITVLGMYIAVKSQVITLILSPLPLLQWLTLLKESINPTQPVELRIAVARSLLELWNVVHETVDITVYCKLVVDLLQDADVDVREEMAESVAAIIAQANIPCKWWYTTQRTLGMMVLFTTLVVYMWQSKVEIKQYSVA